MACLSIAIVEDDDLLRELIAVSLEVYGHKIQALGCAEAMDDELGSHAVDLLIADMNLPGEDGFSLVKRFREAQPHAGIMILSGMTSLQDKLDGYAQGADVYLEKPLHMEELVAVVAAFARRRASYGALVSGQRHQEMMLAMSALELRGPAGTVELSVAEAGLVAALARAPGRRLEFWQIAELLGYSGQNLVKASLEVRMVRLRSKLKQAGQSGTCLRAWRGHGYQLCVPVVVL